MNRRFKVGRYVVKMWRHLTRLLGGDDKTCHAKIYKYDHNSFFASAEGFPTIQAFSQMGPYMNHHIGTMFF